MALIQVGDMQYHMNNLLMRHWEKNSIQAMKKGNSDRVYIVDGMERSGKSYWAFQQAGKLDEKMFSSIKEFLSRICFTPVEFFNAIRTVKNGVIIFDEAFRGLSSRSALSKVNKKLIQGLMEMGQNNNIVFIVLPRIWLLDLYPAMLRSNGLFNIYLDKKNRKRVWRGFNYHDKNQIYQLGAKKGWKYLVRTGFRGNFYDKFPGGDEFMDAYLKKKSNALRDMDKTPEKENKFKLQRDLAYVYVYLQTKSLRKANEELKKVNISISPRELATIFDKVKDLLPDDTVLPRKTTGFLGKADKSREM